MSLTAYITVLSIEFALLLLAVLIGIYAVYTCYAMIKAAPFVPTSNKHVDMMLALADLRPSDTLMDLGSGDGRILRKAAARVQKAVGIEINPILFWWSRFRLRGQPNTDVIRTDLWNVNLESVSVLTLFFIAHKMDKLHKKIRREMKPGSRVVSYGFRFPHWQYSKKDDKVYLYIV